MPNHQKSEKTTTQKNKTKSSRHKRKYPWKSPLRVFFFVLALVFAVIITINMPVTQKKKWSYNSTDKSMMQEENNTSSTANTQKSLVEKTTNISSQATGSQATNSQATASQTTVPEQNASQLLDSQATDPQATSSIVKTTAELTQRTPKENHTQENSPPKNSPQKITQQENSPLDTISTDQQNKIKQIQKYSAFEKLLIKAKSIGKLLLMVGIAAFLGGLMEARSWHLYFGSFLRSITRAARLPEVIGVSMPIALYSNAGANTILMSSHTDGSIPTSALIAGGMANSYLSHMSHTLRVMYPVIALIGLPGLLFFGIQFLGGFLVIFIAFCVNRYKHRHMSSHVWKSKFSSDKKILDWKKSIHLGLMRSLALIFRMVYITIPLMLGMEWLLKSGAFDFWEQHIPSQIAKYFPSELMSIVVAQIGGLVQSAGVSANLYSEGLVHKSQILLAMLVASAVGNPIRTLRRNLPTALGVYPPKVAFSIVITMQVARFIITMLGSLGVIIWMNYFLF